jgi:PIN domain nuclease of toxin-antitoxin system
MLDTNIRLWHLEGNTESISPGLAALLDRSGANSNLLVCDISYWEVAVQAAKGKLTLPVDVAIRLQRAEKAPDIRFRPLDRPVLLLSTRLPGTAQNDPADRMLIALAQIAHVPLVPAAHLIIDDAAAVPGTPVVDAR